MSARPFQAVCLPGFWATLILFTYTTSAVPENGRSYQQEKDNFTINQVQVNLTNYTSTSNSMLLLVPPSKWPNTTYKFAETIPETTPIYASHGVSELGYSGPLKDSQNVTHGDSGQSGSVKPDDNGLPCIPGSANIGPPDSSGIGVSGPPRSSDLREYGPPGSLKAEGTGPPGSEKPGDGGPPGGSDNRHYGPLGSSKAEGTGPPGSETPEDGGPPGGSDNGHYGPPGSSKAEGTGPPGSEKPGDDRPPGGSDNPELFRNLFVRLNLTDLRMCSDQNVSNTDLGAKQLFGHLEIHWCQDISQILTQVTESICGSKYMCNSYPDSAKDCSFKCYQCQCDRTCGLYGDCCVDTNIRVSRTATNTSCIEPNWRQFEGNPRARMVTRCLSNHSKNDELVQKCERPDIFIRKEVTPVSDETSGISYQNAFCAQCNGVDKYLPWSHHATCQYASKLYEATTDNELWAKVLDYNSSCDINTFPPRGIQVEYRCYPPSVGRCNLTGNWEGPNFDLLEGLCESYEHPVEYKSVRYRNLFCALCNGIKVYRTERICLGRTPPLPHPLSVLLDFGSAVEPEQIPASSVGGFECEEQDIFDPFSKICVQLTCQQNEVFRAGLCQPMLSTLQGVGFSLTFILKRSVGEIQLQSDLDENKIFHQLKDMLVNNFQGILIHKLKLRYFTSNSSKVIVSDRFLMFLKVVLTLEITSDGFGAMIDAVESMNFTVSGSDGNSAVFQPTMVHCPVSEKQLSDYVSDVETYSDNLALGWIRGCDSFKGDCLGNIRYISPAVPPFCPFVEYNLTSAIFSFDSDSGEIGFAGKYAELNQSRLLLCGEMIRLCSDLLENLRSVFNNTPTVGAVGISKPQDDLLSWVSLICLSLSLLGLLLTFLIYSCFAKLRTLPGKITMFLSAHMFAAFLLFLVGSSRPDALLCEVLAIGIHYFWVAVFGWTMIAAYHMYTVFASVKGMTAGGSVDSNRKIVLYGVICYLGSTVVTGGCIAFNFLRSRVTGYGGKVCFISEPLSIAVFFVCPLTIMLFFNIFCFIRTVLAIRSVPDMSTASNSRNRHYVFVYIKIAVLFGLTWAFGTLVPLVESVVIKYVFVVLSGSQGVFIFIAYCLTGKTGEMLKEKLVSQGSFYSYLSKKTSQQSLSTDRKYDISAKETD